ncbi:MAG: dihydropyrimidinase [Spirochaetales bacterium]|jgi:dihydropyrimidinase|nr:dihydropyrimidinase [Spirochaetales bacterium]
MDKLIRNGSVVTPEGVIDADVHIRGELIHAVGPNLTAEKVELIDAAGLLVLPGGIDVHTHLDLDVGFARSSDDWYTGTVAAACGGTTTVIDHPAFGPDGCSVFHQIDAYHELADGKAVIDYGFHGVLQHVNDQVINDLRGLVERGVVSSKVYLTYDFKLGDRPILRILERMKEIGGLTAFHCENHGIVSHFREAHIKKGNTAPHFHPLSRPHTAEAEAVSRVIRLSESIGNAPIYIVHLSTASGLEEIRRGRDRGVPVFAETCPQYLVLDEERYHEPAFAGLKYVMSPPLRTRRDAAALWDGLADGAIQVVGTDHCPFNFDEKKELGSGNFAGCPNGAPGIEARMALIHSVGVVAGKFDIVRYADITSRLPAKIMGLYPRKGALAPGSDADIVLFDPNKKVTISHEMLHERVDYTPYEGMGVTGYPVVTMLRGKVIVREGRFTGSSGDGRYLSRNVPDLSPSSINAS